jgi:hypothetical protein
MEIEVNEQVQQAQEHATEVVEELKEELHHQQQEEAKNSKWLNQVAVSTGILAALAAIGALQANFLSEEGMVAQIKASDNWAYYQAKSTKSQIQDSASIILQSLQKPIPSSIGAKSNQLEKDKTKIYEEAQALEKESQAYFQRHQYLAYSVTALQVAISLSAIAALLRRKALWYTGFGLAALGIVFMVIGNLPVAHVTSELSPENSSDVHPVKNQ